MENKARCFDKITGELWRNGKLVEELEPVKPIKLLTMNRKDNFSEVLLIELNKK